MENYLHQSRGQVFYTCREKLYPDGSAEILICDRPIFQEGGWEPERAGNVKSHKRNSQGPDAANVQRAARRARAALRDLALCNDFDCFVTLTLDGAQVNRYDPKQVIRKLNRWADNKVRRDGLRYVLVPELHKDGAIHFHGFFGWATQAARERWMVDSGTLSVPGRKKPVRPRTERQRAKLLADGAQIVYNLPKWSLGFTTAIPLYGDYHQAVTYVCKYVGKQTETGQPAARIGGRWYYHGGCEGRPLVKYSDQCIRDFEQYPGAYRFDVREAGCSFIRILKGAEK